MESTLVQLIRHFEEYQAGRRKDQDVESLTDFVVYLNEKLKTQSPIRPETFGFEGWQQLSRQTLSEMAVSYIGKMGRYVDNYGRKEMPATQVPSIDEFTYLIVLLQFDGLTKTELIQHNAHPITTGIEIIKRLQKKGFISQTGNMADKRSVRLTLTDQGRMAIFSTAEATKSIAQLATGILSDDELIHLTIMLRKLDEFHDRVHREGKQLGVKEVIQRFMPDPPVA